MSYSNGKSLVCKEIVCVASHLDEPLDELALFDALSCLCQEHLNCGTQFCGGMKSLTKERFLHHRMSAYAPRSPTSSWDFCNILITGRCETGRYCTFCCQTSIESQMYDFNGHGISDINMLKKIQLLIVSTRQSTTVLNIFMRNTSSHDVSGKY